MAMFPADLTFVLKHAVSTKSAVTIVGVAFPANCCLGGASSFLVRKQQSADLHTSC